MHSFLCHWHGFARNPISTIGDACYRLLCCYIIRQRKYYKQRFEIYPKKLFFPLHIFIGNLRGWERQWCCPDRRFASQSKGSWEKKIDIFDFKHCIVYLNRKKLHPTYLGPSDNDGFAKILQHKGKCGRCVRKSVRALKYLKTAFNCADGKTLQEICF